MNMASSRLGLTGLLALALGSAVALPPMALGAENVVLKRFSGGTSLNSVGIVQGGEDTELAGPQAIYAGEGGKLFVLDQVNGRILTFDPKKPEASAAALELPSDLQPTDLVVRKNDIFVWDG
jgi:hypothetical protein